MQRFYSSTEEPFTARSKGRRERWEVTENLPIHRERKRTTIGTRFVAWGSESGNYGSTYDKARPDRKDWYNDQYNPIPLMSSLVFFEAKNQSK